MNQAAENLFYKERFPRSNQYDPQWVAENHMGPNVLWLTEWLTESLPIEPGMRVLDMGCGRAMSSIFLAREFDCFVFATDLWISAAENLKRVREAQLEQRVFPIHAEAHALPFAPGFFDAIVSLDSYNYYGTDDLYLGYIGRFLRPGGRIGIVVPGLTQELTGAPPDYLLKPQANGKVFWEPDCYSLHSAEWWRRHWERSGQVHIEVADSLPDGWRYWADHEHATEAMGANIFPSDEETLRVDAGRTLTFARVVGRKEEEAVSGLLGAGTHPHVWEPEFTALCEQLLAGRSLKKEE